MNRAVAPDKVTIDVHLPPGGPLSGMAADVRAGLTKPFKELSPRYFYDERGSELFERITEVPEYYPTRAEREILRLHAGEICARAGGPATLIELGAEFDLDAFEHVAFWDSDNLWVDIRLRSLAEQVVEVSSLGLSIAFDRGEEMRTEISTKFARDGLAGIYAESGLEMVGWWTDP